MGTQTVACAVLNIQSVDFTQGFISNVLEKMNYYS